MYKILSIIWNNDTQKLRKWLIKFKFYHNVIYIKIPKDPCPTPIYDQWLSLSIPNNILNLNKGLSSCSGNSSCLSSAEISESIGISYSKLPFH